MASEQIMMPDGAIVLVHCAIDRVADPKELKPHPRNPNKHKKEQVQILAKIISRQGWRAPIIVSELSGFIVAGHLRHQAALFLGLNLVPVDSQGFGSEEEELAHMVADNAVSELSQMDPAFMRDITRQMNRAGLDIGLTGLTKKRLTALEFVEFSPGRTETSGVPTARLRIPPKVWLTQAPALKSAVMGAVKGFGVEAEWPE